jgi:hypothetical protein
MLASLGKKILFHHILAFHSSPYDSPLQEEICTEKKITRW